MEGESAGRFKQVDVEPQEAATDFGTWSACRKKGLHHFGVTEVLCRLGSNDF